MRDLRSNKRRSLGMTASFLLHGFVGLSSMRQGCVQGWVIVPASRDGPTHRQRRSFDGNRARSTWSTVTSSTFLSSSTRSSTPSIPPDYERPYYPVPRKIDEALLGDLTGGRPGAIIETEEQLATKDLIIQEMQSGTERNYPADILNDYGPTIDEEADYDIDDPDALDAATLGTWTIQDIRARFKYEWDPLSGEMDPNLSQLLQPDTRYLAETPKDDDGVEIGYDPVFGPSNPIDTRTILGPIDSFMIDDLTRDDRMLAPQFPNPSDVEIAYNEDVVTFRKSLDILETYLDPFLPETMPIPRRVAPWYGYPEPVYLTPGNFTNNRFTAEDQRTDFDALTPLEARRTAVELARSKNAEWLPVGVSHQWHTEQRAPYERYDTLMGTLRPGECHAELVAMIQPALAVLGSCCQLLSIESTRDKAVVPLHDTDSLTIYRFAYHGLMKNRHGMQCWTQTLLEDCGVTVTGVVLETGFRRRDPPYDGGDPWYAPLF